MEETGDEYIILWKGEGFSRGSPGRVLEIQGSSDPSWLLSLQLWTRYRRLSSLEKAQVCRYLREERVDLEILRTGVCPLLDIPASEVWINSYASMAELSDPIRMRLHEEEISPRLLRYLLQVPGPLQAGLLQALGEARLDFSVQEGRRLEDAARRLTPSRHDCWNRALQTLPDDTSARDRGRQFLSTVESWAFPETTRRRQQFEQTRDRLELDGRLTVEPPPRFEGQYLEFRFRCDRDQDLSSIAEDVKRCQTLFQFV